MSEPESVGTVSMEGPGSNTLITHVKSCFMIGGDHWIKKRGSKGRIFERHSRNTQYAALNVDLIWNIFYLN